MLTETTATEFLRVTEASQLLSNERLTPYRRLVSDNVTAVTVATRLVQDRLLTPFQAKVLLKGRPQGFFLTAKYKILDHLGTGGMGRVYLCEHLILQRLVAVKVLRVATPESANGPATQGGIERFYREARAVATLNHKNIAQVFDVDQTRGAPFMVMEYVDGVDLHKYVTAQGALEPINAADYIRQAAEGLQHAHEAGLIHRDIKPSNLLLDRAGTIRVLDLGLARFRADSHRNQGLTERFDANVILGTADFMAPEQAVDSSRVDIRADIYSLGCTLYYMLTGKMVFESDAFTQKMMAHQFQKPTPIRKHALNVPEALETIVFRMLEKKPEDRFQTPAEVAQALTQFAVVPPGPPSSKSMPKITANSYRLGLCPAPTAPPSTGMTSTISVVQTGSASGPVTVPLGPQGASGRSSIPRVESGVIRVGPVSEASQNTPAGQVETARVVVSEAKANRQPMHPERRRIPKAYWIGGGLAVFAIVGLAVAFWPESPASRPVPVVQVPKPNPELNPNPNPTPNPVPGVVATISGGGSSFARPIMDHWAGLYKKPGATVKYASIGSSKGIEGVIDGTLAFGCTDAPLTASQLKQLADKGREVRQIPVVLGAVVPIYNLPEIGTEKLIFTGPVLADIYLGKITHWDDEAILANNPLVKDKLTHRPIAVTQRSDGSGTTYIWTDYLSAFSTDWAKLGKGTTVKWPVGKGYPKSDGVTDGVNNTVGAIGYVELSHALQLNLRYGLVKNRQGTVIPPTFDNVTAAAASLGNTIPDDLVFSLVDRKAGERSETAYPITGATWALLPLPKNGKPDQAVVDFLEWATHDGQKYATDLRYAPLPKNFADKLDAVFYRLKR
ncbi:MAG: phosphate ABC transporter substrate-binding protein PstS [Planctomycetaceae bacterium]|nr:phosphate ABC transporter substrate-binding protein PstS [Planctomycetaceae bacterium]